MTENYSTATLLGTFTVPRTKTVYSLRHHTAGIELAGSGTRQTREKWTVGWALRDGTNGSRAYSDELAARASYEDAQARYVPAKPEPDEVLPAIVFDNLPSNDPARRGFKAAEPKVFGFNERYSVFPVHTRFGKLEFFVTDRLHPLARQFPIVIRQELSLEAAMRGLW